MHTTLPLLAVLLSAPAADPKPEAPPAAVKEVLDSYLKAIAAKNLDGLAARADVPWLDRGRQVVRARAGLRPALERAAAQLPADEGQRKVEAFRYKKIRDRVEDAAERKLLDEIVGDDGWLVSVAEDGYPLSERIILIRVKDGKAAVVGGPLKQNQITPRNRIPDAVERLLTKAESFELYSLDPVPGASKEKDGWHGWKVLGKTVVKGAAERKKLTDALRLGAEDNFGMVAACFIPRHGLRLTGGGKTVDLVICFECLSVQVFENDTTKEGFLTSGAPQKEFDAALKAAGVPLPKPAQK